LRADWRPKGLPTAGLATGGRLRAGATARGPPEGPRGVAIRSAAGLSDSDTGASARATKLAEYERPPGRVPFGCRVQRSSVPLQVHETLCATLPPPLKFPHESPNPTLRFRNETDRPTSLLCCCSAVLPLNGALTIRSGASQPAGCSNGRCWRRATHERRSKRRTARLSFDGAGRATQGLPASGSMSNLALPTWSQWHRTS